MFNDYFFFFRTYLVNDSDREPPHSLQKLTECLCDEKNTPLLHDPALDKVGLCYEALPHYKTFVSKREAEVKRGAKEREKSAVFALKAELEAKQLEEVAARAEREAVEMFQCSMAGVEIAKQRKEKELQRQMKETPIF